MEKLIMTNKIWIYIFVSGIVSLLIRESPILFIRKPITSSFIKSFLYYVPYCTLALMTFPAIILASSNIFIGILCFLVGAILAWQNKSMFIVAAICSAIVFIGEII